MKKKDVRLNIKSVSGYLCWLLQFNVPEEEVAEKKNAYYIAGMLLQGMLGDDLEKEEKETAKKAGKLYIEPLGKVKVKRTYYYNNDGFCLSVRYEAPSEKRSMDIIEKAMDRLISPGFDVEKVEEPLYDDPEIDALFRKNFEPAKAMIKHWQDDIFERGSVEYKTEYWDPYD